MSEAFPMLAMLAWQIVLMSAVRYLATASRSPGLRLVLGYGLGAIGLAGSVLIAVETWAPTVAFWWWIVSLMVAALIVLIAAAYSRASARAAAPALFAVCVVGGVATLFAL